MYSAPAIERTPLVVTAGNLCAGSARTTFYVDDRESLLHSYLVLIRKLRGQQRQSTITLRGEDISVLAEHLGASEERILDDLLDRMGATRAQRKALLAMFAAGVLTIVATGSVALDTGTAGAREQVPSVADGVAGVVELPVTVTEAALEQPAASAEPSTAPSVVASEPVLAIARGGAGWEYAVSLHQLMSALAQQPLTDAETAPVPAPPVEGVGVADDGSVVGVGLPPVPPVEGVGVADDGSVVGVGLPPVPPVEGVGVADDGSVVGVGLPPVPPVEGVGVADDGSVVGVGLPPVPPGP